MMFFTFSRRTRQPGEHSGDGSWLCHALCHAGISREAEQFKVRIGSWGEVVARLLRYILRSIWRCKHDLDRARRNNAPWTEKKQWRFDVAFRKLLVEVLMVRDDEEENLVFGTWDDCRRVLQGWSVVRKRMSRDAVRGLAK